MSRAIKRWEFESFVFNDGRVLKRHRRSLSNGHFLSIIEEYYNKNSSSPFIVNSIFKRNNGELITKRFKNLNDAVIWCDYMAIKNKWFLSYAFNNFKKDV